MAENSDPHSSGLESSPITSDETEVEFEGLSQANRELLADSREVLKEFNPQPGVLYDLPQVTVEPADTERVCRIAKEDPRAGLRAAIVPGVRDYKDSFQLVYILTLWTPIGRWWSKPTCPSMTRELPSVTPVWRAGEWYEREAHDLFGVVFEGHPDPAPLLLYEGFEGYPGRKEFPFNDYQEF